MATKKIEYWYKRIPEQHQEHLKGLERFKISLSKIKREEKRDKDRYKDNHKKNYDRKSNDRDYKNDRNSQRRDDHNHR